MACLDLHYYVTVHENKLEKKEAHLSIALGDLQEERKRRDFTAGDVKSRLINIPQDSGDDNYADANLVLNVLNT